MIDVALQLTREAGLRLMRGWGAPMSAERKGDASNVVTQADRDAERVVVDGLRARFPDHSIVAEESGCALRGGPITWVVDPLDGTSNYAAGLPWFGVLVAALRRAVRRARAAGARCARHPVRGGRRAGRRRTAGRPRRLRCTPRSRRSRGGCSGRGRRGRAVQRTFSAAPSFLRQPDTSCGCAEASSKT